MIYAFNTIPNNWQEKILSSLKEGTGRFGCMYDIRQDFFTDDFIADLNKCKFLKELKENDYVVYTNMPEKGKCILAKVKSGYYRKEPMDEDFNHCFKVYPESVMIFDRNSANIPPFLRTGLKLKDIYGIINYDDQFDAFITKLSSTPETEKPKTKNKIYKKFHII